MMAFGTRGSPWANWTNRSFSGPGASAFTTGNYSYNAAPPPRQNEAVDLNQPAAKPPGVSDGLWNSSAFPSELKEKIRAAQASTQQSGGGPPPGVSNELWNSSAFPSELKAKIRAAMEATKPVNVADSYGNVRPMGSDGSYAKPTYNAPEPAPELPGLNIRDPGDVENWYADTKDWFGGPTRLSQWTDKNLDRLSRPTQNESLYEEARSRLSGPTNAQREYDRFERPDIASEPGFGSYFDRAEANMTTALQNQMRALGQYGSSEAMSLIGNKVKDLRGDQALKEADYNLSRLGEQRQWGVLGKDLARNADLSGQGIYDTLGGLASSATDSSLDRFKTEAETVGAVDAGELARKQAGGVAANTSQAGKLARVQQVFGSTLQAFGGLTGLLGDSYQKVVDGDMTLFDAVNNLLLTKTRENANYASSQEGKLLQEIIALTGGAANVAKASAAGGG